jgi:hypothetical protein
LDKTRSQIFHAYWLTRVLVGFLLISIFIAFGSSCAKPVALTGGPRDTIAPVIMVDKSMPNFQTNFEKQTIELEFDEFVNVKDVFNQVVVSPPLKTNLKISSRGKKVTAEFAEDEELKEAATYTIFFGDAIRDFNESNILENYRFVFSTGDIIDSLQLKGQVIDANTNKAKEGVLVMLYEDTRDSVVYTDRPFYFAKTNKSGAFALNNLKEGHFKIFALKDENLNYKYDAETEWIGFSEELIYTADSSNQAIEIQVFQEKPKLALKEQELKKYGSAKFQFNQSPESASAQFLAYQPAFSYVELEKDSLLVYYDLKQDTSLKLAIQVDDTLFDTLSLRKLSRKEYLQNRVLKTPKNNLSAKKQLKPGLALELKFNSPIDSVVDSLIIRKDSLETETSWYLDSLFKRKVYFQVDAKPDESISIEFLKGAIVDVYGTSHDTFDLAYKYISKEGLGAIQLNLTALDSATNYAVILKKKNEELVLHQIQMEGDTTLLFKDLLPDSYELKLIEDKLPNGQWDPGNYALKLQSERQIEQKLEPLRENWTLEVTLSISDLFPD